MNAPLAQYWLQWWARPWLWADPSWGALIAERQLSDAQFAWLSSAYPEHVAGVFGVQACSPSLPDALIVALLQAGERREAVLAVAEHLCSTRAVRPLPDEQLRPWCRSVAKALRPGSWLPEGAVDPLQLLAQWRGTAQWERLRLLWPRALTGAITPLPCTEPKRLDTLWRAALQRALETPDVHSSHP